MEEYSRVLSNPDNLIMSDELNGLFQEDARSEESASLYIDSEYYVCNLISVNK